MPVASELLVKVNADVSNLTSGLNQADKQVSGFAKSAGALGSVATAGFVALGAAAVGLGAGIASSVSKAIDFQQGIADVGALVNATTNRSSNSPTRRCNSGRTPPSRHRGDRRGRRDGRTGRGGILGRRHDGGVTRGVLLLASATGTDVAGRRKSPGDSFNESSASRWGSPPPICPEDREPLHRGANVSASAWATSASR
jgi:hypothetical protein